MLSSSTAAAECALSPTHDAAETHAGAITGEDAAPPNGIPSEATHFEQMKASKLEFQEGIALFNTKPNKGIDFLQKLGNVRYQSRVNSLVMIIV